MLFFGALVLLVGCQASSPAPSTEELYGSRLLLEGLARDDAWAQAHLMLAFATDSRLKEVREGWSRQIEDPDQTIHLHGDDGVRGEQHPHLMLRTVAWGLPSARSSTVTRAETALGRTASPSHWKEVNDLAWLVEAAAVLQLDAKTPTADGDVATLAATLLDAIEQSDQIVQACLDEGVDRPDGASDPSRSGTWAYTCGGLHLLSALVESVEAGYLVAADRQRVVDRLLLLVRRIPWELQFRLEEEQRAVTAGISARRAARYAVLARMKLAGHGLDLLGRCRATGLLSAEQASEAADSCLQAAQQVMKRYLEEVDPEGILLSPRTEKIDPLTWERAFGDGCHLLRGLAVWYSVSQQ